jgi:hypothetical protein
MDREDFGHILRTTPSREAKFGKTLLIDKCSGFAVSPWCFEPREPGVLGHMSDRWKTTAGGYCFRFFSPDQVDQILRDGASRGRQGSHAAIERILRHEPGLARADLWQRIRLLKRPLREHAHRRSLWDSEDDEALREGYEKGWKGKQRAVRKLLNRHPDWRPHTIWRRAAKLGLTRRASERHEARSRLPWADGDEGILLELAGYKTVRVIAKALHRSEAAVRCHLNLSGKSSRVHQEGFARHALAAELHLAPATIRRLVAEGLLEVRDPRITRESLNRLSKFHSSLIVQATDSRSSAPTEERNSEAANSEVRDIATREGSAEPVPPDRRSRAKRVWAEVARSLETTLDAVEKLVARGVVKVYDSRITEKSLQRFCRQHGAMINPDFLNRDTRQWLLDSMDYTPGSGKSAACRLIALRKHAEVVHQCKCGRAVRGNAFFRHIKGCAPANLENKNPKAVAESGT